MSEREIRKLGIDVEACTGCQACSLVCVSEHHGRFGLEVARIRVHKNVPELAPPRFKPVACRMCPDAPCVAVCPTEALWQDEETGFVGLDEDLCIACGFCEEECPFDAIWVLEDLGVAIKCDLCGGDPVCVRHCSTQAVSFEQGGTAQKD